jgi:hypothetical protein
VSSWACLRCRTVYAVGIPACPHCGDAGYSEGGVVAKASAEAGSTHYVAEGQPVPDDLPPEVRLVGPGVPAPQDEPEPEAEPEPAAGEPPGPSTPPENSGASSAPGDDDEDGPADYAAYPIRVLRDLCRERDLSPTGAKAELVGRLAVYDEKHQDGG